MVAIFDKLKEPHSHFQVSAKEGLPAGLGCHERLAKNEHGGY